MVIVGANNAGTIGYEPSYGEHDWLMEAALATTVSNVVGTNGEGTGTATFTATGVTVSAGTPFAAVEVGQWIRVPNAAEHRQPQARPGAHGGGRGHGLHRGLGHVRGGNRHHGRALPGRALQERHHAQDVHVRALQPGPGRHGPERGAARQRHRRVDSVDMAPGSILGGQYTITGKDALAMATGSALPGTGVASLTNQVMNAVTNFSNLLINGVALSGTFARKLQLTIKNNIRPRMALGVLGPADLALGPLDLEVSFEIYLADATCTTTSSRTRPCR
jgi:hypothetical protein